MKPRETSTSIFWYGRIPSLNWKWSSNKKRGERKEAFLNMAESGVNIRIATLDDIAGIVELNYALFREDAGQRDPYMNLDWPKEEGHEHFAKFITNGDSLCLMATAGEALIGYLVGYLWHGGNLRPIKLAELESMFVRPKWRSRGVGRKLAEEFFKWARGKGAQRASVTAYAANARAIAFYRGLGFDTKSLALEIGL